MSTPSQMTVKEALEKGYVYYGYKGREYQHLSRIDQMTPEDWEGQEIIGTIILADIEPRYHTIDAESLMDFVADDYHDNEEIMDDTQDMDIIIKNEKKLFEEITAKINEVLQKKDYYLMTDIELIP